MPDERRPVPSRVAAWAVDIVGTGMSSPSSSPFSSNSRSSWVTISSYVAFSSRPMLTERFSLGVFSLGFQFGVKQTVNHRLWVFDESFFSALVKFFEEIR